VVVDLLLEKGADIDIQDDQGDTALHLAVGHEQVAELLLEKGADINRTDRWGMTALHEAARNGHEQVVGLLLKKGADVNAKDQGDGTALHEAAAKGHEEVVRLLLEKGADINAEDAKGRTALHAAVKGREVEREEKLRAEDVEKIRAAYYGVEVAVKGADSAQCKTARKGHRTVIRLLRKHEAAQRHLLKNHADINTTASHGKGERVRV